MIIRLWDISQGIVVDWQRTLDVITSLRISPDGTKLLAGLYKGQCFVFSLDSFK